jgi:hypothetical protein
MMLGTNYVAHYKPAPPPIPPTTAEFLLAMAEQFLEGRDVLITDVPGPMRDAAYSAQIEWVLKFRRLSPAIHLRAIVEGWDYNQCKAWTL